MTTQLYLITNRPYDPMTFGKGYFTFEDNLEMAEYAATEMLKCVMENTHSESDEHVYIYYLEKDSMVFDLAETGTLIQRINWKRELGWE